MFIRFAVGTDSEKPRGMNGPFTEVEYLRQENLLYEYEEENVSEIFKRFNDDLPCPPWSYGSMSADAVSWFKDDAQMFISRMFDLVAILHEHGIQVRMLKAERLWRVIYEDEYQVVSRDKRF